MKPCASGGLFRNVLPLPYRVQIHMNLRDHRHQSVNQVRTISFLISPFRMLLERLRQRPA
jgi:hypothetical protein